jgi:polygalacturonase
MMPIDVRRRELLKLAPFALAPVSLASGAAVAQSAASHQGPAPLLFDVRTYGATGDGKAVDTPAINKAIEAAAAVGGGLVVVPAGNYVCFSIRLKSHVGLYLSQGATIVAAASPLPGETTGYMGGTYDAAEPKTSYDAYQDYGHNHWHNSLIWAEDAHDFSITGPGTIYGKGLSFGAGRAARGNYPIYVAEQAGVGNKAIALKNCRNVILRDFSILKGGHFGLLLTGVDNLTIDNLTIDTDRDGMDIDCCRNVHVSNCTVNSPWDDAICPKSSFALGYNRATENVTIANCYVSGCYELGTVLDGTFKKFAADARGVGRTGRIKCGTESNGGFKNITITGCVFEGCQGLALESEDGALCEDITISNITQRDVIQAPLFFRLGARLRGPKGTGNQSTVVGTLQRVLVSNFVSYNTNSRVCSILSGIPGYDIKDIKLSNVFIEHQGGAYDDLVKVVPPENVDKYPDPGMFGPMPAAGFFFRHVRNLELSHVEVAAMNPDPRPSFYLQEVSRVDLLGVTASTNPKAFSLHKVTDLRAMVCRATPDVVLGSADGQAI